MPRYVVFLRAINAGRGRTVKMETLRRVFELLGFSNVSSFIASGNIIFETRSRNTSDLEDRIEEGLMEMLGLEATPFVRSIPELRRIAGRRPFPPSKFRSGDQLGVLFLGAALPKALREALTAAQTSSEEFRVIGREVYWLRHRTAEGEAYATVLVDRILEQPFTIRSVSTVRKLAEKLG